MPIHGTCHNLPVIGFPVEGWTRRPAPPHSVMPGRWCRVEPIDVVRHGDDLFDANREDVDGRNWTYLTSEPLTDRDAYRAWLEKMSAGTDPFFHAIVDNHTNRAIGVAAFLRIDPANGVIEVGHINYSPRLQRTVMATEAMYLMMKRVFDELGYRRYEWKCDELNAPSRSAAERLGFSFEGIFRQAIVYKGRNRDTAWYSMLDREWPPLRAEYERWLDRSNFDEHGRQRTKLATRR
jgi:RimJ/RimL family protein N-acetyltransferase